jgi:hypothetical protein
MSNPNLRNITNHFLDVRLVSLASWRGAGQIEPRDRGGPYVVLQEGYDPNDMKMTGREFILGRSGKWLALEQFYQLPQAERREEFVFGKAGEVMEMMNLMPPRVAIFGELEAEPASPALAEPDELRAAIESGKTAGPAANAVKDGAN